MKKKALVVDDDPNIRNIVQAVLEGEGWEVDFAEDGQQGVDKLDSQPRPVEYAIIILDVVMPGMNGLDVMTRIRLHPHTQKIPVLMLTGEDKAEDIMSGYSVGADYYITKPFTRQQLLYGINLVLGADA
ncbi:MAG: response regulator [Oligoflexia bacterium]|nr:response regulator [Oligoflexia bacterium]